MKSESFKIPAAFLNQLEEFTTGFYLVSLNEKGEFETNSYFPTPASAMALLNFLEVESGAMQESVRQRAIEKQLGDTDDDDNELDGV